jgi:hypothetical protein
LGEHGSGGLFVASSGNFSATNIIIDRLMHPTASPPAAD